MRILVAGEQGSGKTSLVSVFSDGEHNRGRIGGVAEPSTSMFGISPSWTLPRTTLKT